MIKTFRYILLHCLCVYVLFTQSLAEGIRQRGEKEAFTSKSLEVSSWDRCALSRPLLKLFSSNSTQNVRDTWYPSASHLKPTCAVWSYSIHHGQGWSLVTEVLSLINVYDCLQEAVIWLQSESSEPTRRQFAGFIRQHGHRCIREVIVQCTSTPKLIAKLCESSRVSV